MQKMENCRRTGTNSVLTSVDTAPAGFARSCVQVKAELGPKCWCKAAVALV